MKGATPTRREFLQLTLLVGAAAAGGPALFLQGCENEERQGEFSCTDTSKLSEAERETRKSEQYVDTSTTAGESCRACRYFLPSGANACGKCTKIMGPIHPQGHCKLWKRMGA